MGWQNLTPEEQEAEHKAERSLSYQSLLLSAGKTLKDKEREVQQLATIVTLVGIALFLLWLWNEDRWAQRLATAQTGCLTPMSDGSCGGWDPYFLREKLRGHY